MTQTNCPRCNSTRLEYQQEYGYWGCLDCGQLWGFDADDPDYAEADSEQIKPLSPEELAAYEDSVACWDCHGTGRVYILGSPMKCTECKGTGYI